MRRTVLTILSLVAMSSLTASVAFAGTGAHFFSASASVSDSGALVVSWDEAGLGSGSSVDYSLSADSTADYGCLNGGGHNPSASNKHTVSGPLLASVSGLHPKGGRIKSSLGAGPLSAGSFSCPKGQKLVLADVTYSNIVLTDTTNNVSTNVGSVSRTFFKFK